MTASADSPLKGSQAASESLAASSSSVALATHINTYADQVALLALNAEHLTNDGYDSSVALRAARLHGYARTARLLAAQDAYSSPALISSAAIVNSALREFCKTETHATTYPQTADPEC